MEAQVYETPVKLTKAPVYTYAPSKAPAYQYATTKAPSYQYPPVAAPAYAPTTYTDLTAYPPVYAPTAYAPNPRPLSINHPKRKCGILRGGKCALSQNVVMSDSG
jgi:hypothetical protein